MINRVNARVKEINKSRERIGERIRDNSAFKSVKS